ncbi:hypothetical protein CRYUN_Cryun10bG0045900 [Craigia yunnanensis]
MQNIVEKSDKTLVHGMALSHVFRHLCVSTICNVPLMQSLFTFFNEHFLKIMDYVKNRVGVWIKKMMCEAIDPEEVKLRGKEKHQNAENVGNNGNDENTGNDRNDGTDGQEDVGTSSNAQFHSQKVFDMLMACFESLTTLIEGMNDNMQGMATIVQSMDTRMYTMK